MITREKEPPNLEMPFGALEGLVTPTERFYVRCHFPIPKIDEREWRLKVEGRVARAFEMTMDELREMPAHTIMATIECAGNSRVFLVPKVKGVQWELGAVGNAEWTGVRLRDVLERARISDSAHEIIFEGADNGTIAELPRPAGKVHFARSVPVEKAMDDVLLAFAMNGEAASRRSRFSAARHRARLVRDGVGQMASATHCHRSAIQWLLSVNRLRLLEARGERTSPCPVS
jgi:DMSO/TMAO reductase YedYZ molybdopterin-dependent catalytic subunit